VQEIVTASREGGASLTILSGIVSGNFSAYYMGLLIAFLLGIAYFVSFFYRLKSSTIRRFSPSVWWPTIPLHGPGQHRC